MQILYLVRIGMSKLHANKNSASSPGKTRDGRREEADITPYRDDLRSMCHHLIVTLVMIS